MRLIDGWHQAHKFASVQLAAIAGLVAAYFAAKPEELSAIMAMLPEWAKPLIGFALFAVAAGTRVVKKG